MGLICCISTKKTQQLCAQLAKFMPKFAIQPIFSLPFFCWSIIYKRHTHTMFVDTFLCIYWVHFRLKMSWVNNSIVSFNSSHSHLCHSRVHKMQNNEHLSITKWRRLISFSYILIFMHINCTTNRARFFKPVDSFCSVLSSWLISWEKKAETNFTKVWCCSCCAPITIIMLCLCSILLIGTQSNSNRTHTFVWHTEADFKYIHQIQWWSWVCCRVKIRGDGLIATHRCFVVVVVCDFCSLMHSHFQWSGLIVSHFFPAVICISYDHIKRYTHKHKETHRRFFGRR